MNSNLIFVSDDIRFHTATTDNEPAAALEIDIFLNYVGSMRCAAHTSVLAVNNVCCAAHTLALAVNNVFKRGTQWQKYMDIFNSYTSYFNQNQKANMLFRKNQA